MGLIAAIRPDDWGLPFFLHVLGALALIGALGLTAAFLVAAWRDGSAANLRQALRSLALGVLPAWLVLRVAAEWISDKEGYADLDDPPAWINFGYIVGDGGFLLILISIALAWIAYRRARTNASGPAASARAGAVIVGVLLVLNVVALWAMTTKPA